MTDEKFDELKNAVKKNATQTYKDLKGKVELFCSKIKDKSYEFNQTKIASEEIEDIVKEDVIEMFQEVFVNNIRRLEIHMVSPLHKEE